MTNLRIIEIEKMMRSMPKIKAICITHQKDYVAVEISNEFCRDVILLNIPQSNEMVQIKTELQTKHLVISGQELLI
jgi:hypothetical protein